MKILVLLLLVASCAHKMDYRVLGEKVEQMEARDLQIIKEDMTAVLAGHPQMTQEMKTTVTALLDKHISEHQRLKAEESKALQVLLEDTLSDPDSLARSFGKKKLSEIYQLKSTNVLALIDGIRSTTASLKDRPAFYREMSILMRELR